MASSQLLLLVVLLTRSVCTTLAAQCPNCGGTPVPYPLSTEPTCGDQSYKILCDEGELIFDTVNNSYPIISIDPFNQRLVIKPADVLPYTCMSYDFIHHGIQLNRSLPFNVTSSNTVMLFNCSDTILDQPLDCTETSLCRLYLNSNRGKDESQCENASLCCAFQAGGSASAYAIRVREAGCRAYRSFVNLNSDLPVERWPSPAVELQWELPQEPLCGSQVDCEGASTCQPDQDMDGVRRCYCKIGLSWDPIKGICTQPEECQSPGGCGRSKKAAIIAGLTCSAGAFLLSIIVGIVFCIRHKRIREAQKRLAREREKILSADGSKTAKLFSGKEKESNEQLLQRLPHRRRRLR